MTALSEESLGVFGSWMPEAHCEVCSDRVVVMFVTTFALLIVMRCVGHSELSTDYVRRSLSIVEKRMTTSTSSTMSHSVAQGSTASGQLTDALDLIALSRLSQLHLLSH